MDTIPVGKLDEHIHRADSSDLYNNVVARFRLLTHPLSCLLHILFKVAIAIAYFVLPYFFGLFTGIHPDVILSFAIALSLVLVDFLVVKNHTAVNLIGVHWYLDIKDNGSFDLLNRRVKEPIFLNNTQVKYFWIVTYTWPLLWLVNSLFRLALFKLGPFVLSVLVCVAGFANLYNYSMCFEDKRVFVEDTLNRIGKMLRLTK